MAKKFNLVKAQNMIDEDNESEQSSDDEINGFVEHVPEMESKTYEENQRDDWVAFDRANDEFIYNRHQIDGDDLASDDDRVENYGLMLGPMPTMTQKEFREFNDPVPGTDYGWDTLSESDKNTFRNGGHLPDPRAKTFSDFMRDRNAIMQSRHEIILDDRLITKTPKGN